MDDAAAAASYINPLTAWALTLSTHKIKEGGWLLQTAAASDLLAMLSKGILTPPASVRYPVKDFQEAVRLADGEAGQEKVLLDFANITV